MDSKVDWGRLMNVPNSIYPWNQNNGKFQTGYFAGFEGTLRFTQEQNDYNLVSINIFIDYGFWGDRDCKVSISNDAIHAIISQYENTRELIIEFALTNISLWPKKFSIGIGSDPQPWRLINGDPNDENEQKDRWHAYTNEVFAKMSSSSFSFVIINGDITEFGRKSQYESFTKQTSNLINGPVFFGLGNHDYENNVNDCANIDELWSMNSCARFMVRQIQNLHETWYGVFPEFSYDPNSLAYSWTYGEFRFIQANNYPNYTVLLDSWILPNVMIESSLNWIKKQIDYFPSKKFIINMHKPEVKDFLNSERIAYVFTGHTHAPAIRCYGGHKYYDSGAMFKLQYFKLDINDNCVKITFYPKGEVIHNKCNATTINETCTQNILLS